MVAALRPRLIALALAPLHDHPVLALALVAAAGLLVGLYDDRVNKRGLWKEGS